VGHKSSTWAIRAAVAASLTLVGPAGPVIAGAADDVASLLKRIDDQEQRIRALEQRLEVQQEQRQAVVATEPVVYVSPDGIALKSEDQATQIRFHGELTLDGRFFTHDVTPPGSGNTWIVRRARPIVDGTFGERFDFRFNPDFASGKTVIQDGYIAGRFLPWAVLTAGKFKQPFGMERLQFSANNRFLELGLPSDIVPNRDLGLMLSGIFFDDRMTYQIGWFNGTLDGVSSDANAIPDVDNNDNKDLAVRLVGRPFLRSDIGALQGLSVGAAVSYVDQAGSATNTLLPSYRSEGQRAVFSYADATAAKGATAAATATIAAGKRLRWSPQASYYYRSVGAMAEYASVSQGVSRAFGAGATSFKRTAQLKHDAWQLYATYLVTGESATYTTVVPNRPFAIGRSGWGAFELAARYSRLTLDPASFTSPSGRPAYAWFADPSTQARQLRAWTLGVNWYLTQNIGWMLDYGDTRFAGGAGTFAALRDRADESWLFTRFQVNY
jgi:phosphate-selective porin OprO/OprP